MEFTNDHKAKTVGYVRSELGSSEEGRDLLTQIHRIRAAGVNTFICDTSNLYGDQEGLTILLELAQERQVQEIVVTRWDRLVRNFELYPKLKSVLKVLDIKLRTLDQCDLSFSERESDLVEILLSFLQPRSH